MAEGGQHRGCEGMGEGALVPSLITEMNLFQFIIDGI